ncbi:MAG: UDP-N-acetylmuramyl-tripeptide synthetase [Candidatus Moranbacteria bacterium GW2011_GWF2_37_7]|nr:MAG: UDP-N-acetylmuramyl-tripeptide synthetase [Candidatus Moranbacteria bacterium GW2011_GWF2_37_7]KKQ59320.1 MAG: UDP-N-acetylmuramyl-tripeptide synthetase [Parcubacteria group bacterium GW2011_GWD1_38_16]
MRFLEKYIIPRFLYRLGQLIYHPFLAFFAATYYGFPSRKMTVIGITGTKGKSSTIYFLSKIFEEAGYKTAAISSIQFKIAGNEWTNKLKMTMPGRSQIQKFLADAVAARCKFAIIEVTSQGVEQSRHRFINFDTAVFTNLAPEHIEAHGSFEAYKKAKLKFFKYVKNNHVLNKDDKHFEDFSAIPSRSKIAYSFKSLQRMSLELSLQIVGEFNLSNAIAAIKTAEIYGIPFDISRRALEKIKSIPGRMEFINEGQNFKVIVDYAHTPDSLVAVYETVEKYKLESKNPNAKMICILGSAGGGRDKWKRPEMGKIVTEYCDEIILTNEDPYDENPEAILEEIASGFSQVSSFKFQVSKIIDRREAIRKALRLAKEDDVVIMTGKGSESLMMMKNGRSISWDDRQVAREEIRNLHGHRKLL